MGLPQRAADERFCGRRCFSALQSPRGKHLDRPRRHWLLADIHGRGSRRRRRCSHRALPHRGGQSDIALVGGSHNSERPDLLMLYEFGGYALKDKFAAIWDRKDNPGVRAGIAGCLPGDRGARTRRSSRRKTDCQAVGGAVGRSQRKPGDATAALKRLWDKIVDRVKPGHVAVISGASGTEPATTDERTFLAEHQDIAVRATGTYVGRHLPDLNF